MRAKALLSIATLVFLAACGAKQGDTKAPDGTPTASGTTPPTSEVGPSGSPSVGPPTTTTATLGNGTEPGTKLPPASSGAPAVGGVETPKKGSEPGRTREDIQAIVVARRDEARACYDEGLKKNPSIEGDLDIAWKIDPEGNVTDPGVDSTKSTIRDEGVANCIIAIIKRVKFAKSAKGFETKAHYPFNFHPKAGQVGKGGAQPAPKPSN